MAVATGPCPSCGAPIEFRAGSSVAKVCEHCRSTVYRTDRGLEDLGKVSAIANIPALIAVGDSGTLAGRPFLVLGRVQLDHGAGPWDEYYVEYEGGSSSGYLAYAEGNWYATMEVPAPPRLPSFESLRIEHDVALGSSGAFRISEVKTGRVTSAEGEFTKRDLPGSARSYADLHGDHDGFATVDYGNLEVPPEVFVGKRFDERELRITAAGPRTAAKVKTGTIRCPNCGGDMPKLAGERAERIGCRYCGAVSDIAAQTIISQQETAMASAPLPIGATGSIDGFRWVVIAYVRRSSEIDGESFSWEEQLLFAEGVGFRWLVNDEGTWLFVESVNLAELHLGAMPGGVTYRGDAYRLRNRNVARVDFVIGELYWKCEVGETVRVSDFTSGRAVLSREESPGEVRWSHSKPIDWTALAQAFSVPVGRGQVSRGAGGRQATIGSAVAILIMVVVVLAVASALSDEDGGGGGTVPVYGGSGWYSGGK